MVESKEYLIALMAAMDEHQISDFQLDTGKVKVSLKRELFPHTPPQETIRAVPSPQHEAPAASISPVPKASQSEAFDNLIPVNSPLVGTFYQSPSPDDPPFVTPGQKVKTGDTLCIIEAMKTMNEIKAPQSGTIHDINGKNGQLVEFGQLLFQLVPESPA